MSIIRVDIDDGVTEDVLIASFVKSCINQCREENKTAAGFPRCKRQFDRLEQLLGL